MAEQAQRQLSITSPLGKDVLLLTRFEGEEGLSKPFQFTLQLLSEKRDIKPEDLVGKKVTFSIKLADGKPRFFHGFVSRLRAGRGDTRYRHYTAEVVSWLSLLAHTNDCRIFQNKSVIEIIEAVFGDHKFAEFKTDHVSKRGPTAVLDRKLEYCVQYRESDLNFVTRLMEENGVHYYFTHEEGKHTLVLTDSKNNYPWCAEKEVEYVAGTAGTASADGISEWTHDYEIRPSAWAYSDYDFKNPKTKQLSTVGTLPANNLPGRPSELELEVFDYPGDYVKPAEGKQLVELRMGEEEARYNTVTGASACRSFITGGKFKFKDPDQPDEDGKTYVLSKMYHDANEPAEYESGAGSVGFVYQNKFECIPDSLDFRPPREARRPFVHGPQTAVVTGPGGADVFPDEFGRVKVQFFWDRYGKNDDNSSCWLRVSQTWAGNGWGSMHIPWVGQEVIVDFLEGNPDRPIITGRVYNADQMPPLTLPAAKHKNVVARDEYGNEIIFDHSAGNEHIRIHSPHHNSTFELGKSFQLSTQSDDVSLAIGNSYSFIFGNVTTIENGTEMKVLIGGYHQAVLGFMSDSYVGGKVAFSVGSQTNVILGGLFEFSKGWSVGLHKGKHIELNDEGHFTSTKKDIYLDADKTIGLLGGPKDTSALIMNENEMVLTFQKNSEDRMMAGEHGKKTLAQGMALTFASALAANLATNAAACQVAKALADAETNAEKTGKAHFQAIKDRYNTTGNFVQAGITATLAIAGTLALRKLAKSLCDPKVAMFYHNQPQGELRLDAEGARLTGAADTGKEASVDIHGENGTITIKHQNKSHITLEDEGNVQVNAGSKEITFTASDFNFMKGTINHKALLVKA